MKSLGYYMAYVIGIDQSYKSAGVCIMDETFTVKDMYTIKTDKTQGDVFYRANIIAQAVAGIVKQYDPVFLGLEGLAFAKFGDATRDLAGLQFTIVNTLRYSYKFDKIVIPTPNEVKKYATGKGNADKEAVYDALPEDIRKTLEEKNYRKTTGLYDIADAYWIAKYALEFYQKRRT
jgi:Holliday junction resolvasome RuvABC endonuclease subunit